MACSCGRELPVDTLADAWEVFSTPQDSCRTKVWWFHGETETTKEGITADLEAFRRAGVGGVVYYDQMHAGSPDALDAFSPQWWEMLKFSSRYCRRLEEYSPPPHSVTASRESISSRVAGSGRDGSFRFLDRITWNSV